jgi:hypothetical protein
MRSGDGEVWELPRRPGEGRYARGLKDIPRTVAMILVVAAASIK